MKYIYWFFLLFLAGISSAQVENWELEFAPDSNYIKVSKASGEYRDTLAETFLESLGIGGLDDVPFDDSYNFILAKRGDSIVRIDPLQLVIDYFQETTTPILEDVDGVQIYYDEVGTRTELRTGNYDPCDGKPFKDYSALRLESPGPLTSNQVNASLLSTNTAGGFVMDGPYKIISYTQNCEVQNPQHQITINGVNTGPIMTNGTSTPNVSGVAGDRILIKTVAANNGRHCWHSIGVVTEVTCN